MPLTAPPAYTAVHHAQASSAAPSRTVKYVVQPGDNLWSIAQQHYGTGFKWDALYQANSETIGSNPNQILAGQVLTVPGVTGTQQLQTTSSAPVTSSSGTSAASSPAASSPSARSSPSSQSAPLARSSPHTRSASLPGVPSQAATYIRQAAAGTRLPVSVVAAQNFVESGYGTNIGPSSAGAIGPWQFMPGTFADYSNAPLSQAWNWNASTSAYINFMNVLLKWSGGNIQQALAAYNAGQGNWQAGLGYANTILGESRMNNG